MGARAFLIQWYRWQRRLLAPTLEYAQYRYQSTLEAHLPADGLWLDLGCGRRLLPEWRADQERALVARGPRLVGLDPDLPSLRDNSTVHLKAQGSAGALPFCDSTFGLVTANMVLEHLAHPEQCFREVHRVLRPGGLFLLHTPNARGYGVLGARLLPRGLRRRLAGLLHGREEEDVFDTHYRANTPRALRAGAAAAGLEVRALKLLVSDAITAAVPPLAFFELLWLRALMARPLRGLRPNLIAVLEKPASGACDAQAHSAPKV